MAFLRRSWVPSGRYYLYCSFCAAKSLAEETLVLDMYREAIRTGAKEIFKYVCRSCVLEHCTELYQEFVVKELTR